MSLHTPVCACRACLIERHTLVGYLRIVARELDNEAVDVDWLLSLAADRIEALERAATRAP